MKTIRILAISLLFGTLWMGGALADGARKLQWDDLAVRMAPADNPFSSLSVEQLEALADVAALRDRKARGIELTVPESTLLRAGEVKLQKTGVDADALLSKRDAVAGKQQALASTVNPALDGQIVRLPGYMLPLEFSGKQVTEFLLVPWVGACIHTPPPPPNQIVHVKADKPFDAKGMFDAVWVTGKMTASASKRAVYIVDGASEVDAGYSIRASSVERY